MEPAAGVDADADGAVEAVTAAARTGLWRRGFFFSFAFAGRSAVATTSGSTGATATTAAELPPASTAAQAPAHALVISDAGAS